MRANVQEELSRKFKLSTAGAATVAGSAPAEKTFNPSTATPKPPLIRERSRSNENRYGHRNRSTYVDPQTWNEMCSQERNFSLTALEFMNADMFTQLQTISESNLNEKKKN